MSLRKLNIKPDPDFNRLEKILKKNDIPDRVPFFELFSNIEQEILNSIETEEIKGITDLKNNNPEIQQLKQHITYMYTLGYDYVSVGANNMGFPQKEKLRTETKEGEREYVTASQSTISSREDFEKYPWPDMSKIDYSPVEKASKIIPEGMKNIPLGPGGVLENVMWLLGYEGISFLLYDDEQLVKDMFEAVATRIIKYFDTLASFDIVGAVILGDDMGFKTQTMLSPEMYRKYLFPWHTKIAETIHKHGKPAILHACGNLKEVMDDIINCGWDAKHSFEDAIEPVWEAKKKYSNKIALLGGFDMNKISQFSEDSIRSHTRFLMEKCAPDGGWALGTGNSVANYVPVHNFLTMLEQGFQTGFY